MSDIAASPARPKRPPPIVPHHLAALVTGGRGVGAEEHDDEDEEDDDGAGVDDELDGSQELRVQRQVDAGDREDRHEQTHRAANGILRDDGEDRSGNGHGAHTQK